MKKTSPISKSSGKINIYIFSYIFTFALILSVFTLKPHEILAFPALREIIVACASILLLKYFLYMLLSPWHDVKMTWVSKKRKHQIDGYKPLVSIMIPAWNESYGLINTVKSILKSTYSNIQIIVINDGSTDDSHALMTEFIANYNLAPIEGIAIRYLYKENSGKGESLNVALGLAKGEIIMSIDADCLVDEDAVENFVKYFADPKVMAAVGNVKIGNTNKLIGTIQSLEFLFSFYFKKAQSITNTIYIIGGAAGAFRRQVFEDLGPYNTKNITEDIELSIRIQDSGMKIVYASDAVIYTEGASDIRGLMKQRLRWKRGRFETFFHNKHLFFSFRNRHNKLLSWFVLPLELFGEMQLSLEIFFIIFLYFFSYITNDFSSFISGIVVVSSMFLVQMFFDNRKTRSISFYFLAPIGWMLFYVTTFIEWTALINSCVSFVRGKELKWQTWERKGVIDMVSEDTI